MSTLLRSRISWSGSAIVGPGLTTLYNDSSADPLAITAAIQVFFDSIKSYVPTGVTWHIPNGGDTIDSVTGDLTGAWTSFAPYTVNATGLGTYAAGVGGRLDWQTTFIINKRRVRGALYIVPMITAQYENDGTLNNAMVSAIENAAHVYLNTTGMVPRLWHRPNKKKATPGAAAAISSAVCPDTVSWLRSRRT